MLVAKTENLLLLLLLLLQLQLKKLLFMLLPLEYLKTVPADVLYCNGMLKAGNYNRQRKSERQRERERGGEGRKRILNVGKDSLREERILRVLLRVKCLMWSH